jgi:superfamily I DNA and/or RNA helicase
VKMRFKKLVLVGDHEQLPATVTCMKAKSCDYQQSLFGRLVKLFSTAGGSMEEESMNKGPVLKLKTQYRMHADICDWPNRYIYGGELRPGDQERESLLAPYTILNLVSPQTSDKGAQSKSNQGECTLAVQVADTVRRLTRSNPLSIGIITFYAKQKAIISLELQNRLGRRESGPCIDVNNVDGFQGSERDVIIISCVRSGGESIGFLGEKERLNVALTRAKYALILIGDLDTLKKHKLWSELISHAASKKVIINMASNPRLEDVLRVGRKILG